MTGFTSKRIMSMGRQHGKGWSTQAYKRLMDDLMLNPVTDLILSKGTIYGSQYYTIEPVGGSWLEMEEWAVQTYGGVGSVWHEKNGSLEPLHRWYMNDRRFWFRDEKDLTMFILRWS